MVLIGTRNIATQTVLTDGAISLGSVYRKYCKRNSCGVRAFETTADSVLLQHQGIYHLTATFVGTGTVAGDVTVQLLENGIAIAGALSTETITTATTEIRTFVIDHYILVDDACLLGKNTTLSKAITFQNTGVGATFTAVTVNIEKVV